MGLGRTQHWQAGLVMLGLLVLEVVSVGAQGGDTIQQIGNSSVSLVNPFTGDQLTVTVLRLIYIVGGLILLFFGWSAYRLALGAAGFVVGASFGASLTANAAPAVALLVTIILGVLGGVLASFVYLLAVALVGGYMGLLLTGQALAMADVATGRSSLLLIYGIGLIVGAGVALALAVELTIILTSGLGAIMLAGGTGLLDRGYGILWTALLFALGVVVQMRIARSGGRNPFERRR